MSKVHNAGFAAFAAMGLALSASAQLRVATWNISNFGGGRAAAIQASVYGMFEGRCLCPDVLVVQEVLSASAVTSMLATLNTAPGSPGDWAAAAFIDGPDTDSGFFYRTGKAQYLGTTVVALGSSSSDNQPRHTYRYDMRPVGYGSPGSSLALYSVHMKAGSATLDQSRRLVEAQRIRRNASGEHTNGAGTGLPSGWRFLVCGDFNIQSSSQAAYQELIASRENNSGRFFDPIATPGSWNNNGSFRFVHTQDPAGAGGMDDRHDQILLSATLIDGEGLSYIGDASRPYSTVTWDDPSHTYRAWGNDGTSFDQSLRVAGNTMVGPTIAQALIDVCNGAGHLPIVLDLRVPARVGSDLVIDLGSFAVGEPAASPLKVWNAGDAALWSMNGLDPLRYTLSASPGFTAPGGVFASAPGAGWNTHTVSMDTSTPGLKVGTVRIFSNAPDEPERVVVVMGEVVEQGCPADFNGDGFVDFFDLDAFVECFEGFGCPDGRSADFNGDGFEDFFDLDAFVEAFESGC
ncbi:MAG: endonuclease/exonuclease/phosphatase family protein [Phycisphaeraceae bacterium]|nr:MAG: endonuclease/exonuclease/phosphatase family protein [Phycisphaeraceae bacterium]